MLKIVFCVVGVSVGAMSCPAEPNSIEEIRAEYAAVSAEKLTAFEIPFEVEEISGKVTLRFNGGEIRSAVAEFGAEHGWETISSYYKDGVPFFVLVEDGRWRILDGESTWETVKERRYYFVGGKAIRILEKSFEFKGGSEDAQKKAALKAENRPVEVEENEVAALLRKVRLIVAARSGAQVEKILFP